ncbi:acetyltransferase [Halobacillus karajensis]|uniref:Acetyltransferase EpsM n=1 Tax=Halobacillus karajensis TaxID=195088 RepID=A0A059NZ14_9BACI|nr:acetyltransferase [Halobacillus karajensis]CDQ18953.1 Putative acetyltransferase EpsM [Halobacillus karajensis]CDQ22973.1 Putative acetyltransferase EpsM [Halobacillus karajensis]CDQ26456.1 Putative acetyltransferase EpsM [Halobacillus karajensis]
MKKVVLIGAGGHSKVIQDIIEANRQLELYAIFDDKISDTVIKDGITYSHTSKLSRLNNDEYLYCIAIGNNKVREELFKKLLIPVERYVTLIHPSAVVSNRASIGYGSVIMPNAVVNSSTIIGKHCIVNSGAIVEHDNNLEDYVHISPNATLSGTVKVSEGTHIGSGAVIIPGRTIGRWSTVGAGSVVIDDVESEMTVVGIPARNI